MPEVTAEQPDLETHTFTPFKDLDTDAIPPDFATEPQVLPGIGEAIFKLQATQPDDNLKTSLFSKPYCVTVEVQLSPRLTSRELANWHQYLEVKVTLLNKKTLLGFQQPNPSELDFQKIIFDRWASPQQFVEQEQSGHPSTEPNPLIEDAPNLPKVAFSFIDLSK